MEQVKFKKFLLDIFIIIFLLNLRYKIIQFFSIVHFYFLFILLASYLELPKYPFFGECEKVTIDNMCKFLFDYYLISIGCKNDRSTFGKENL